MSDPSRSTRDQVVLDVDGRACRVRAGVSVAAALLADQPADGWRPGIFCGMGVCYACVARVDGVPGVRTCLTPVAEGMRVERSEHG